MATENMPQQAEANKNLTHVIYGLYAASLVVGTPTSLPSFSTT